MTTKRVLFVSLQVGMGHVTRDVAIVNALRLRTPHLDVSWVAHPLACKLLAQAGESILPESRFSADYNQSLSRCLSGYRLNIMRYLALGKKAWADNADLLGRVIAEHGFDLVIGDESYELTAAMAKRRVHLRCRMILIEDVVGLQAMTSSPLERIGVYVQNRRLAMRRARPGARVVGFFVGELEDVPDGPFGFRLPNRRDFAAQYYHFLGYVIRFDPAEYADKAKVRARLGYGPEPLLVCATGGTSAGKELVELCGKAYTILKAAIPDLRMVAVCGELFGAKPPELPPGVELHSHVPDLHEHYAACDLAVVVGGGTTTVELTALRRPFIFFPLENQFDQQLNIADRLARHGAGIKMRFYETTPRSLAEAIGENIGREATWPSIRADGAERAAKLVSEVLDGTI